MPARSIPSILFADRRFVVLDKPSGIPVHPGPRGGPSIEDSFRALRQQLGGHRDGPWLAHRLDADTAGCLLVALRRSALHLAQAAFATGTVGKIYWGVVAGQVPEDHGTVSAALEKQTRPSGWRMVADASGAPAQTEWRVLGRSDANTWLELRPRTGRTHQVRVHCASLGFPIIGDPIYGASGVQRLHLLARSLALPLDPPVAATAPPPPHMHAALSACGWAPGED